MAEPFRHTLRVRFHECDPQNVVFNANFLAYADIAITELYREAFGSWSVPMDEHGVDMVVAEANTKYFAPLHFDEELNLAATVTHLGTTSVITAIAMERGGDQIAEVMLRHVVIDANTRQKTPIPDSLRTGLQRYAP